MCRYVILQIRKEFIGEFSLSFEPWLIAAQVFLSVIFYMSGPGFDILEYFCVELVRAGV